MSSSETDTSPSTLLSFLLELISSSIINDRTMVTIDPSMWTVISALGGNFVPPPASAESIEGLPVVKVIEPGSECVICLAEYEIREEAKEMPCKHMFHSGCIENWLRVNGTCPVCRYQMPVEEGTEITVNFHVGFPIDDVDADDDDVDADDDDDVDDDDDDFDVSGISADV